MKNKKVILIIAIIAVILIGIGLFLFKGTLKPEKEETYKDFTLTELKGEYTKYDKSIYVEGYKGTFDYAYYVTGKIKSSKNHSFTVITFDLYDKDKKLLGTAVAGLNKVDNEYQKFKALSLIDSKTAKKTTSYKLKSVE